MNTHRRLVCVGIVLILVSGANAQFGDMGSLLNKKLNKLTTPTNQPPAVVSDVVSTAQPPAAVSSVQQPTVQPATTTDTSGGNSTDDSGTKSKHPRKKTTDSAAESSVADSSVVLPPLFEAAEKCDEVQFVEALKKDMSSVNKSIQDIIGTGNLGKKAFYTPLDYAAEKGCTNIIEKLLDLEVDVNGHDSYGGSPLQRAVANGHLEAVKILLKAKANPATALKLACKNNHAEILEALIAAGGRRYVDLHLLSEAAQGGYPEIVRVILRELGKADPEKNYQNRGGSESYVNIFCHAAKKGNLDIVKMFVADGANLYSQGDYGKTVKQNAIEGNQSEVLAYLKNDAEKDQAAAQTVSREAKEKEEEAKYGPLKKQLLDALNHPRDVFDLANARYRKINGKVYDCAEPLEWLNRYSNATHVKATIDNSPSGAWLTPVRQRQEEERKWLTENPWLKAKIYLEGFKVIQVTSDGLIVQLNEGRALLKNHPKQKTFVDGDANIEAIFVVPSSPYTYKNQFGEQQTILAYDLGAIIKPPSGSVEKLPLPNANN